MPRKKKLIKEFMQCLKDVSYWGTKCFRAEQRLHTTWAPKKAILKYTAAKANSRLASKRFNSKEKELIKALEHGSYVYKKHVITINKYEKAITLHLLRKT